VTNRSKFAGVFDARKQEEASEEEVAGTGSAPIAIDAPAKPRGRPAGKRSSSEYTQTTAYIRQETHKNVKRALLDDPRDFSELVEDLLRQWLDSRS
jgi:hypothetical protein